MNPLRTYTCPVCGFGWMDDPPEDHAICACCGTHFGYDDVSTGYRALRNSWLRYGGFWFDKMDPAYAMSPFWNAWDQLSRGGYAYDVPAPASSVKTDLHSNRTYASPLLCAVGDDCVVGRAA